MAHTQQAWPQRNGAASIRGCARAKSWDNLAGSAARFVSGAAAPGRGAVADTARQDFFDTRKRTEYPIIGRVGLRGARDQAKERPASHVSDNDRTANVPTRRRNRSDRARFSGPGNRAFPCLCVGSSFCPPWEKEKVSEATSSTSPATSQTQQSPMILSVLPVLILFVGTAILFSLSTRNLAGTVQYWEIFLPVVAVLSVFSGWNQAQMMRHSRIWYLIRQLVH